MAPNDSVTEPTEHRHLIVRHRHPGWLGHSDPTKHGYKPADRTHWHFWWRHTHD